MRHTQQQDAATLAIYDAVTAVPTPEPSSLALAADRRRLAGLATMAQGTRHGRR